MMGMRELKNPAVLAMLAKSDPEFAACLRRLAESIRAEVRHDIGTVPTGTEDILMRRLARAERRAAAVRDEIASLESVASGFRGGERDTMPEEAQIVLGIVADRRGLLEVEGKSLAAQIGESGIRARVAKLAESRAALATTRRNADLLVDALALVGGRGMEPEREAKRDLCPPPVPSAVVPARGRASVLERLIISGSAFGDGAIVRIAGQQMVDVEVPNQGVITGVLPPIALGSHDVIVINPDGQSGVLRGGYFAFA